MQGSVDLNARAIFFLIGNWLLERTDATGYEINRRFERKGKTSSGHKIWKLERGKKLSNGKNLTKLEMNWRFERTEKRLSERFR